jgi:hypothetical protein
MPTPEKIHDLHLPNWGPYSKHYAGIAHIPDIRQGLRFDLGLIPGHYRRQMLVPNEKWACGHHAWEASPNLDYCAYRYEIEWKDQLYADISFSAISDQSRLVRCEFVNHTDLAQNLALHLTACLNFPPVRINSDEPIKLMRVTLPEAGVWVDALDYEELQFATSRPTDSLAPDGMIRAEVRAHGLVNGNGIGCGFGLERGDWTTLRFVLQRPISQPTILFRYRLQDQAQPVLFQLEGAAQGALVFAPGACDEFGFSRLSVRVASLESGEHLFKLISLGGGALVLDGFAIVESSQTDEVRFTPHTWNYVPQILPGPRPNSLILQYADTEIFYGLAWEHPDFWVRQFFNNELDILMRYQVPDNDSEVIRGAGEGHFTDLFLRPIFTPAHTVKTIYSFVCAGSLSEVTQALAGFIQQDISVHEATYLQARQKVNPLPCLPAGETYRFSQERMAATELMNVVYPVYTRRQYIRHNTPGKWWDCLYTWDSGFIGMALLELDIQRAYDCLNTYLTDPGDTHAAFVHHGSPVPVQIYLFHEIWNHTQDRDWLAAVYPALRQYYLFLAGRLGSSTTRNLNSNLLITWEYFFDSGGWDDYPAQMETLKEYYKEGNVPESGIKMNTACAAITAHAIRSARILNAAANALGFKDDQQIYQEDIEIFSSALQRFAWDDEAGYFSYVLHDVQGNPTGHLQHKSGLNYNMGLDGVMPLLAGICTPQQEALLFQRLADPSRFWTPIGLSTVDQSAPYYRKDGYWNGAVWFPQQWFMWKTALDLGRGDFAYQIAKTALDLWKNEVEATYYCFEHFLIESGRGAGWHQFGGLSSPVLSWFSAYHVPGRLTTGLDIWVEQQQFSDANRVFHGSLCLTASPRTVTVIVNMQPGCAYSVLWNGIEAENREINRGSFQIQLPFEESGAGQLVLTPRK